MGKDMMIEILKSQLEASNATVCQLNATVASVIQTAVKNGQNPFEVLRVIATLAGA